MRTGVPNFGVLALDSVISSLSSLSIIR